MTNLCVRCAHHLILRLTAHDLCTRPGLRLDVFRTFKIGTDLSECSSCASHVGKGCVTSRPQLVTCLQFLAANLKIGRLVSR